MVFVAANPPTENTSPSSDDTIRRPFSTDYSTKYPQMDNGEDDSYMQYGADYDETASNEWRFGDVEDELLFTDLDARYAHPDGVLGKELPD